MSHLQSFLDLVADWKRGDLDAVAARLSPDVVWHFSATTKPPAIGREESIAFLKAYGQVSSNSRLRLFTHAETEDRLFYEAAEDFDGPDGQRVLVPYAGIVDFAPDGLITGWRDYFDRALIDGQVAGTAKLPDYASDLINRPSMD
ncbi:nuclear transport factor 2 family protein [Alkalicaulis satelles]|uniref:Nuclear transport factor 2 family protein n=1 Tax=Alkalicaulis satelles TaxID=2609175 RepID=A0A5M6ZKN3_9PROT|nr:nuclear transport factor 2 family protein [Alkalicaulis satelles]KAA5805402.1 nuclear transport factor 2 family protein [Alkalicaulis satelles]